MDDAAPAASQNFVEADPFLLHATAVRGFVYDVSNGGLREVLRG